MNLNRRTLLVGGGAGVGLLLAWGLWPRSYRPNLVANPGETIFNAFLKIAEDGHVTVVVPQAEMGQGCGPRCPRRSPTSLARTGAPSVSSPRRSARSTPMIS